MKQTFQITSVFEGVSPSSYFSRQGNYLASIGVDPDLPQNDAVGTRQTSGLLRPSGYASFDSGNVTGNPYWILTSPKTALVYAYMNDGKLVSYTTALTAASEALIGTPTSGAGNGAAYYNNYLYLPTATDISVYGPLNSTATLYNARWTGSMLGTQTALTNTTYPSIRGAGTMPNHPMHVHTDNKLYFGDFLNGVGYIHWIRTTRTTKEGDTNDSSTYNALDLPFGFMPTDIESWGNDIVISAIQTTNSTLNQGKAALFFWDTVSASFYNTVWLPDNLITALYNNNGKLYIFSGAISTGADVSNGYRISVYLGGQTTKQVYYSESGSPPLAGAVDSVGERIVWGTFEQLPTTTGASPEYYGVVMAMGSKRHDVPQGVHGIINSKATGTAADGLVTAIKNVQQSSFSYPKFVVGWRDSTSYGLDKQSTTYGTSIFRSQMFNIGKKFIIKNIRIPLGAAIAANMTITPKVFLDDYSSSSTTGLTAINSTNYPNSERSVVYTPDISGKNNFCLELRWSGTALLPVLFPIDITVEIYGD